MALLPDPPPPPDPSFQRFKPDGRPTVDEMAYQQRLLVWMKACSAAQNAVDTYDRATIDAKDAATLESAQSFSYSRSDIDLKDGATLASANRHTDMAVAAAISTVEIFQQGRSIPDASNVDPKMDGVASSGSSFTWSRGDHAHPSDTSRVPTTRQVLTTGLASGGGDLAADRTIAVPAADGTEPLTNVTHAVTPAALLALLQNLPTVLPGTSGQLWWNAGVLNLS